jgi:hypothetical protein
MKKLIPNANSSKKRNIDKYDIIEPNWRFSEKSPSASTGHVNETNQQTKKPVINCNTDKKTSKIQSCVLCCIGKENNAYKLLLAHHSAKNQSGEMKLE